MFERFTTAARDVVVQAQVEARTLGHNSIGTEHVLLAALSAPSAPGMGGLGGLGVTAAAVRAELAGDSGDADALRTLGIDLDEIRRQVERAFGPGALDAGDSGSGRRGVLARLGSGHIPFTAKAKRSLNESLRQAQARGDRSLGVEHLLLGVLAVPDGLAIGLLARLGVSPDAARAAVLADLDAAA